MNYIWGSGRRNWRAIKAANQLRYQFPPSLYDESCVLFTQKAYYTHGRQVTLNSNFLEFREIEKGCQPLAIAVVTPFGVQIKG